MSLFFDEASYLRSKLSLMSAEEKAEKHIFTTAELKAYMENVGLTHEEHYNVYGRDEGLNPNPYFNENEYLLAKLDQLHSIDERDPNGRPYTLETLKKAIADNGMTPIEHYERYGAHETKADGTLINPSNAFDANAAAKLYQLQHSADKAEAAAWADKTPADVMQAIKDAGMSPVSHYLAYGAGEANADKVPLVQTVPSEQRVANDPLRDHLGENVPPNYNPPSEGPAKAKPAPVDKPADVGDLVDHAISPEAAAPADPVKVPGDKGYVAPPDNITDTNANPVIPPTTSGTGNVSDKWLVVNSQNSAIVVDKDGAILGEVNVSTTDDGTVTVPPSEAAKPVDKLPAVDPGDLPPNVEPGHEGDNIKTDTPDVPDTPYVPTPAQPAAPTLEKITGDDFIDMGEAHSGVIFTGKAQAGSTVTITVKDENTQTGDVTLTGTAKSDGTFSIQDTKGDLLGLKDGTLTVTATAAANGLTSASSTAKTVGLDAVADETITSTNLGYSTPTALKGATLGSLNPNGTGLLDELQKVYNAGKGGADITVTYLNENAPNIAKLVHFSEDKIPSSQVCGDTNTAHLNLDVHDVYGGGVALMANDLKNAIQTSRVASLIDVIGKAYFDVPVIEATAKEAVHLEVDKVGSIHKGALTADLLNHDLTFSSLVELFSEMKPIAVEAKAPKLDIHLADGGDAANVNLMEVRGTVTDITFSGTKGLFGLNIDAHPAGNASGGTVKSIDASSLTDAGSGVYVNTAPINLSLELNGQNISKGVNATGADGLTFTGSAGDDILVMTQGKYGEAGTLDGGNNTDAGDTLAVVVENATAGEDTTISVNDKMKGFENVAFVSLTKENYNDDMTTILSAQFAADAAAFHAKGVNNFITTNDLTLTNYGGETVTVMGFLDAEININLKATSSQEATINLAMTSNFLTTDTKLGLNFALNENSRAVLTNADKINNLILKGHDANADILLTDTALQDLSDGTIDVSGYMGDIQLESGWSYNNNTITKDSYSIAVTGIQSGTDITTDAGA